MIWETDRAFVFYGEASSLRLRLKSVSPFTIKEYFWLRIEVKNKKMADGARPRGKLGENGSQDDIQRRP
jgi:hypothetical protein